MPDANAPRRLSAIVGLHVLDRSDMQPGRALSGGPFLVERWLARKRAATVVLRFFSAIALLAMASVTLTITFFLTYAIVWFGYNYGVSEVSELLFSRRQHISHGTILITCWCFLALLFFTNARVRRDYWSSGSVSKSPWVSLWLAGAAGFYGRPGAAQDGSPGPAQRAGEMECPILALQAGDDQNISSSLFLATSSNFGPALTTKQVPSSSSA